MDFVTQTDATEVGNNFPCRKNVLQAMMEEISSQSGVSSPNLKEQITRQVLQYVLYGKNSVQMVNTHETNIKSKLVNDESSQQDQRSKTVTKLMENSDPTTETDNTHAQSEKASINLSYAIASFPNEVSLCVSSIPGTVFGVCAKQHIPVGTWIGPYEGKSVCPDDVTVDMNTSHMWEIYEKGKLAYFLDGSDKNTSSWMRFIRCARHKQEQNLLSFQHNKDVFYRAFRDIPRGCELLVWYEDSYIKHMGIPFGIADRSSPLHFTERVSRVKHPVAIRAASLVSGSVREEQELLDDVDSGFKPCRVQKRRSSLHSSLVEEVSDEPESVAIQRLNKRFKDQQESDSDSLIHNEANVRPSLDRADNGRKLNTRKNELTRHRKLFDEVIDTSGENGEFKCGQCKIIFTQRSLLNSHLCSRMPCKPYRCGHCQEAFAQPKELRMHSVVHVSEKPFKCGYCLRAFSGATTLNNHVRTHTGEKPFLCERCGKSFSQAFQLSRHRRVCTQNGE